MRLARTIFVLLAALATLAPAGAFFDPAETPGRLHPIKRAAYYAEYGGLLAEQVNEMNPRVCQQVLTEIQDLTLRTT